MGPNFFHIIRPLVQTKTFPLLEKASEVLKIMKNKLVKATLQPIDETLPFTVEPNN